MDRVNYTEYSEKEIGPKKKNFKGKNTKKRDFRRFFENNFRYPGVSRLILRFYEQIDRT